MRFRVILALAIAVAGLLVGCQDDEQPDLLEGSQWELTRLWDDGELIGPDPTEIVTLSLESGSASGFDGCNSYRLDYRADDNSLEFSGLSITGRACPSAGTSRRGEVFVAALLDARRFVITDATLDFLDDEGLELLSFRPTEALPLLGIQWRLEGLAAPQGGMSSPLSGTELNLYVDRESRGTGSTGCNGYQTAVEASGEEVSFGEMAVTEIGCREPAGIMDQEHAYLDALARTSSYRTSLTTLELFDASGSLLLQFQFGGRVR